MKTAKIFTHGHSQAVRLPKEFRFDVTEVYIENSGDGVILTPKKPDPWRNVRAVAGKFKGTLERAQPQGFDHRDWCGCQAAGSLRVSLRNVA
jgi:virulence-associated protein VagC